MTIGRRGFLKSAVAAFLTLFVPIPAIRDLHGIYITPANIWIPDIATLNGITIAGGSTVWFLGNQELNQPLDPPSNTAWIAYDKGSYQEEA